MAAEWSGCHRADERPTSGRRRLMHAYKASRRRKPPCTRLPVASSFVPRSAADITATADRPEAYASGSPLSSTRFTSDRLARSVETATTPRRHRQTSARRSNACAMCLQQMTQIIPAGVQKNVRRRIIRDLEVPFLLPRIPTHVQILIEPAISEAAGT